jgi:hypothetical protein
MSRVKLGHSSAIGFGRIRIRHNAALDRGFLGVSYPTCDAGFIRLRYR